MRDASIEEASPALISSEEICTDATSATATVFLRKQVKQITDLRPIPVR
jgi:hypothetical protein